LSVVIDTNVLVRFIARDDADQHARAAHLLARSGCRLLDTVLLETEWVLRKIYKYSREQIAVAFEIIGGIEGVTAESPERLTGAITAYRAGMDFADAFHIAGAKDAHAFASFDIDLIKKAQRAFSSPSFVQP
jgi:predicted nucleic-acid-binding protein